MNINDQLDTNAADLRVVQAADLPLQANALPHPLKIERNVSKAEMVLAIGILIGAVAIVYLFLQVHSKPSSNVSPQVQQQWYLFKPGGK